MERQLTMGSLLSKAGESLGYEDNAHPHTVTHVNGVESYRDGLRTCQDSGA